MNIIKDNYGKAAIIGFVVLFYFFLPVEFRPVLQYAYAEDNRERDCKVARIEWSMANENLRYAKTDLKELPNNETLQKAKENYERDLDDAQRDINENCK